MTTAKLRFGLLCLCITLTATLSYAQEDASPLDELDLFDEYDLLDKAREPKRDDDTPQQPPEPKATTDEPPAVPDEPPPYDAAAILERYGTGTHLPDFPIVLDDPLQVTRPVGGHYYHPRGQNWVQFDYLSWWFQGQRLPPLVESAGGDVLFGGEHIDDGSRNGLRLLAGRTFAHDGVSGWMVDLWGFEHGGTRLAIDADAADGDVLPFTNMTGVRIADGEGTAASVPIDRLGIETSTEIWSGGIYYRGRLASFYSCCPGRCRCPGDSKQRNGHRADGFVGYRYVSLQEKLDLNGAIVPASGAITAADRFRTQNDFHGIDFGFLYERELGRLGIELLGKIALGANREELIISGRGNQAGGLLAQYTNIARYRHYTFTAIPEVGANLSYSITSCLRVRGGYSFQILTNVIRPGSQLNRRVDGRFFDATVPVPLTRPRGIYPLADFETDAMWLHGLNFGLELWF